MRTSVFLRLLSCHINVSDVFHKEQRWKFPQLDAAGSPTKKNTRAHYWTSHSYKQSLQRVVAGSRDDDIQVWSQLINLCGFNYVNFFN